ncbi:helix-turn-helix transcriptional regulator [Alteriqipengyuania lutimaris]|uniref:helix-turn-helix transcriptional regulator n=1 Tax=Alteriqipengyuania lutimaris TaxID=1538146 RepID=UPI001CFDD9C1|nr:AlpA family phage regulatory protein [Alteriqipengyuania lutimaris]
MDTQDDNASPEAEKAPPPPTLGIRPRELMREYGIKKSGLAILIRDHGHPRPIALGKRSSMFIRSEVDAWLESRKAERDAV